MSKRYCEFSESPNKRNKSEKIHESSADKCEAKMDLVLNKLTHLDERFNILIHNNEEMYLRLTQIKRNIHEFHEEFQKKIRDLSHMTDLLFQQINTNYEVQMDDEPKYMCNYMV